MAFAHLPQQRRLPDSEKKEVSTMLGLKVNEYEEGNQIYILNNA